jgi:hypothetical protein
MPSAVVSEHLGHAVAEARTRLLGPMTNTSLTLGDLERWELFGATWRVVELSDDRALLDMCACTGQPVERRASGDRALIDYVRAAAPGGDDPAAR